MTRAEAIHVLQREKDYVQQSIQKAVDGNGYVSPDGLIRADDYVDACTVAISALRAQQERNAPLTMDELRLMSGEPVWVVTDRMKEWCIVHSHHSDDVIGGGIIMTRRTAEKRTYQYKSYGYTWLAYRHKPEEGTV